MVREQGSGSRADAVGGLCGRLPVLIRFVLQQMYRRERVIRITGGKTRGSG